MTIALISRRDKRGFIAQWSIGDNTYCDTFRTMKDAKEYFQNWEGVTFDDWRTST